MFAYLQTIRTVDAIAKRNGGRLPDGFFAGLFSDWSVTRIVICGLLIPFFLIGANWVREEMNLTGDNDYESRGAVILLLSAIMLAASDLGTGREGAGGVEFNMKVTMR